MKYSMHVCPFVQSFFSGTPCRNFLIFLHEISKSSKLKSDGARFFEKKNLALGFLGQKIPKWVQNEVYAWNLFDFLNKGTVEY